MKSKKVSKDPVGKSAQKMKEKCKGMDISRFYSFCQCSVKMEVEHFLKQELRIEDPKALKMWPHFKKFAARNLGKNEKWVPFHTVLGLHEKFVVENIQHAKEKLWNNDYRRFVLSFIFRAHCKIELFTEVQAPFFKNAGFWKDPVAAFKAGGKMHKAIEAYRAQGKALQTSCFLIIPERLVEDDDENIVLNMLHRTQRLIQLADTLWPVLNNKKASIAEKYDSIKGHIENVRGLGETWVKMLMVVIDIARPDLGLLQDQCPLGTGASDPLRKILEDEGILLPKVQFSKSGDGKPPSKNYDLFGPVGAQFEIIAVKKEGKQLLQVTEGAAGSLDRAHAVAIVLARLANKGTNLDALNVKKKQLLADQRLKVPKLGLKAKQKELLKAKAERTAEKEKFGDRSNEPSPSEGLVQLRDRISAAAKGPSGKHFWKLLALAEGKFTKHCMKQPLIKEQMNVSKKGLSCGTLQVQLCEFRQFNNILDKS